MKPKLALLASVCGLVRYSVAADAPSNSPASEKDVVVKAAFDVDEIGKVRVAFRQ